jgi:hypothetical protein
MTETERKVKVGEQLEESRIEESERASGSKAQQ